MNQILDFDFSWDGLLEFVYKRLILFTPNCDYLKDSLSQPYYSRKYSFWGNNSIDVLLMQNEFSKMELSFIAEGYIRIEDGRIRLVDPVLAIKADWEHEYWRSEEKSSLDFPVLEIFDGEDIPDFAQPNIWPGKSSSDKDKDGFFPEFITIPFCNEKIQLINGMIGSKDLGVDSLDCEKWDDWNIAPCELPSLPPLDWFSEIKVVFRDRDNYGYVEPEDLMLGLGAAPRADEVLYHSSIK